MESQNLNLITTSALLCWPLVALWLYTTRPIGQATLWTILGATLLLPAAAVIKLEMIPALDKNSIPSISAFIWCIIFGRRKFRFSNGFGFVELLILTGVIGSGISSILNQDEIAIGGRVIPGGGFYDAGSTIVGAVITLLPFFLGRRFLNNTADNENILRTLVVAGLVYSLPIFIEIGISPQLHRWIYGYYPSDFLQYMRDGTFRPMVFMNHPLATAFFIMTTTVSAAALWQTRIAVKMVPPAAVTAYLGMILVLCRSAAAFVYGTVLVLLVCFAKPRMQLRVAVVLVVITLIYPILRTMDLVPTTFMLQTAELLSTERAQSLDYRLKNERKLLDHASERFWFGWGRFGRARVYDKDTGRDTSTWDGYWIITMGQFGVVGFLATFGLLALVVLRAASAFKFTKSMRDRTNLAALALIIAISVFDLLPNAGFTSWSWLLAGALLGRAEALCVVAKKHAKIDSRSGNVQNFSHI